MPAGLRLTRSEGQRIFIGEDIILTVQKITKTKQGPPCVSLILEAPADVRILREKVAERETQPKGCCGLGGSMEAAPTSQEIPFDTDDMLSFEDQHDKPWELGDDLPLDKSIREREDREQ